MAKTDFGRRGLLGCQENDWIRKTKLTSLNSSLLKWTTRPVFHLSFIFNGDIKRAETGNQHCVFRINNRNPNKSAERRVGFFHDFVGISQETHVWAD